MASIRRCSLGSASCGMLRIMSRSVLQPLLNCQRCPALRAQFKRLRVLYPDYWNRPVPASGPEAAPLLIVGLAPGLKGANRTGKPFVGDASGALLSQVLERLGALNQVRITNVVKCLPRSNKPSGPEIKRCQPFLMEDLFESNGLGQASVVVDAREARYPVYFALGRTAHEEVVRAFGLKLKDCAFKHGARHQLTRDVWLYDSYHCSRYNVQTGRITEAMLHSVLKRALKKAKIL
jgi:uracil-DNA glycosylase family 4